MFAQTYNKKTQQLFFMKKTFYFISAINVAFLLFVLACSKKNEPGPDNKSKLGYNQQTPSVNEEYAFRKIELNDQEGNIRLFLSIESSSEEQLDAFIANNSISVVTNTEIQESESSHQSTTTDNDSNGDNSDDDGVHILIDSIQQINPVSNYSIKIESNTENLRVTGSVTAYIYFDEAYQCMTLTLWPGATTGALIDWQTPQLTAYCGQRLWFNTHRSDLVFPNAAPLPNSASYCLSNADFIRMQDCKGAFNPRAKYTLYYGSTSNMLMATYY